MADLIQLRPGVHAHASGALWLSDHRTAILADLHLGYAWAQRRRGQLGPLTDGGAPKLLQAVLDDLAPAHVVLLGDIVHAPFPMAEEHAAITATLQSLAGQVALTCVLGNHDRRLAADFAALELDVRTAWQVDDLLAIHGDVLPAEPDRSVLLIAGHFHPVMRLRDASYVRRKLRTFVHATNLCLLPAFSPFAGGCDLRTELPAELKPHLAGQSIQLVLTSGARLLPLPTHRVCGVGLRPE